MTKKKKTFNRFVYSLGIKPMTLALSWVEPHEHPDLFAYNERWIVYTASNIILKWVCSHIKEEGNVSWLELSKCFEFASYVFSYISEKVLEVLARKG